SSAFLRRHYPECILRVHPIRVNRPDEAALMVISDFIAPGLMLALPYRVCPTLRQPRFRRITQAACGRCRMLGQPAEQARAHAALARAPPPPGPPEHARHHWRHALGILTGRGTPAAELTTAALRAHLEDPPA